MAESFDALRFGGPIGAADRRVAGTQSSPAFLGAARRADGPRRRHRHRTRGDRAGAPRRDRDRRRRVGRDAGRGADARAPRRQAAVTFVAGDAHGLAFADRSFDAVVCLRVLMHTPRLAAVARRVVPRRRATASSSTTRRWRAPRPCRPSARRVAAAAGARVEAYRVFSRSRRRARRFGPRASASPTRIGSSSCPIALHKRHRLGGAPTRGIEGAARRAPGFAAAARVAGDGRGGALRVLVTGATGFTGGHLARTLARAGATTSGRSCATAPRGRRL